MNEVFALRYLTGLVFYPRVLEKPALVPAYPVRTWLSSWNRASHTHTHMTYAPPWVTHSLLHALSAHAGKADASSQNAHACTQSCMLYCVSMPKAHDFHASH